MLLLLLKTYASVTPNFARCHLKVKLSPLCSLDRSWAELSGNSFLKCLRRPDLGAGTELPALPRGEITELDLFQPA